MKLGTGAGDDRESESGMGGEVLSATVAEPELRGEPGDVLVGDVGTT